MMSEEEEEGSHCFVRHGFSWRSQAFNKFMKKLDKQCTNEKSLAKRSVYGVAINKPAPENIPVWMKEDVPVPVTEDNPDSEQEMFASNGEMSLIKLFSGPICIFIVWSCLFFWCSCYLLIFGRLGFEGYLHYY